MIFLKWLLLSIASIALTVVVYIFALALPVFAKSDGYLPDWLCWLGQWDNSLDGDEGWNDATQHPTVAKLPKYLRRVLWLYRNPAQWFDYNRASMQITADDTRVIYGNEAVGGKPFTAGWCFAWVGGSWMFYVAYPTFPGMYLRVYFGWKLWDCIHSGGTDTAQVTISANPFLTRPI
jgi:hypothetical protein